MAKVFLIEDEIVHYSFKGINIIGLPRMACLPSCLVNLHYEVFISNIRIIFYLFIDEEDVRGIFCYNINSLSKVEFFIDENGGQRVRFIIDDKYYNMQISEKNVEKIKKFLNINNTLELALT
ncbi:hypothetical protein SAMN02745163_01602 [Clostridium cavendishii DSM 21758]|uniref:Uncharacterized protein n=1 Tax=Clostridium cavendishii DSM 21758 TaxID=1121302 RepID=A0A1M6HW78_9CLOT|nr:hypothetical protein [Clostridium cavendishii]SHJ26398.1 hypothetical protein SAMN02745163_01602 [Clostridium cavendishii DSM 21758]